MTAAESTRTFPLADILSVTTGVLVTRQRQHPWLADITAPKGAPLGALLAWRDEMEQRYGAEHPVTAGAPDYQSKDALAELDQMMGNRPVVIVQVPGNAGNPS